MEKNADLNERLRRAQSTGTYWSATSTMLIQELYAIRINLNQGQFDMAKLKINFLLQTIVAEGDHRNTCIEFIEGLIAFHALPKASKGVSK